MNIYNFTNLKKGAFFILCINFFFSINTFAQDNDHIFPAAPAARKYIDFDKQGFIINGKKIFLVSAGMEYARIPRSLWYDRLMRLKRDGFNCVEVYTFWNFHEPHEGEFDFSGRHDLDAFLKMVKKAGMYATCRVGPYYCAEWNFGGYPIWLRFKDSLQVRVPNAAFEKYTGRFFDKLIPIISRNQINHGGSVILVQLENEHHSGWGTAMPNSYFTFLQRKALSLGLQVPYFFSGLHHGSDPAGNSNKPLDDASRPNPWYTTEFWTVWYNRYGSTQKDADTFGRRTWKIIAHGGGGYNYYMAHGGSNFGYSNSNEDAASYDYGAAVGQTGDLRPIYYQFKRNALFARSFQRILCNAVDASASFRNITDDTAVNVYARHSRNGDVVFLDNPHKNTYSLQLHIDGKTLPGDGGITLAAGEIMPVVEHFKLMPGITLDWSVARILGRLDQRHTHDLVVYGEPGSAGSLQFSVRQPARILAGKQGFRLSASQVSLNIAFPRDEPSVYSFKSGAETIRIIAVSTKLADYTWFASAGGISYVVTGPEYLNNITLKNKKLQLTTEHYPVNGRPYPVWVFGPSGVMEQRPAPGDSALPAQLALNHWKACDASAAAAPEFDDKNWFGPKDYAPQMGADGDLSCFAWYRTTADIKTGGDYTLCVRNGGDRAMVFVDGKRLAVGNIPGNLVLRGLTVGRHTLAIFTAHYGRNKLYNYYGAVRYKDAKGLSGEITLQKNGPAFLSGWKMVTVMGKQAGDNIPDFSSAVAYRAASDAFGKHKGYRWFQAVLPDSALQILRALYLRNLPGGSSVYFNGKRLQWPNDGAPGHIIPLAGKLNPKGVNKVQIFMINDREGRSLGMHNPVELLYDSPDNLTLTNWRLKGGPGDPLAITDWKPLPAGASFDRPQWYSNTFTVAPDKRATTVWRVEFRGLGHGSVWVNGHNLGRYPEKVPVNSIYIPECWLHTGVNRVMIYDEDGTNPEKVTIDAERASSREIQTSTF